MKISVSRDINGNRGIQNFTRKLLATMGQKYGVKTVKKDQKSDIHLIIINGPKKKGSRNVVRVDGVYYDKARVKNNSPIAKSINSSDGVIYQSQWAKKFVHGMTGASNDNEACIYNGADQSMIQDVRPVEKRFDKIFVACSHWRPNKRPEAIVNAFLKAKEISGENIGLYVIGDYKAKTKDPSIIYTGNILNRKIYPIFKISDYMVHICHLDACPNSVVEGLSSGLPVLCNNIGGTPELTNEDGIILPLDDEFDFKPIKNMAQVNSDSINTDMLSKGMLDMMSRQWHVDRPDLDISRSAEQYYNFFKKLLG